ncbi:hypothetical protein, unknown function [Leishmania tarentolae]|uniref:Uncharacterized protein n=1 Tax=Leishmania tarentolae TaxID=5689 RepID=A0A640KKA0_LEITA|nr:hypothetical protein, unknown function [Leishmania tarentolae]
MGSPTVQTQWSAAVPHGRRECLLSRGGECGGPITTHDANNTDQDQITSATVVPLAGQPQPIALKETCRHSSASAIQQLQSIPRYDAVGVTHTKRAKSSAAAAAASTAIQHFSSSTSVYHPDTNASSKPRQGYTSFFTRPSSATATFRGTTNGSSLPHPALKSRSISAAQQRQLQHPRTLPRHAKNAQSNCSHTRPLLAAHPQESVKAAPSGDGRRHLGKNLIAVPPVATTAQMRAFSNKTLYVRPRSESFTCTSLPDSQPASANHKSIQVLKVRHSGSPTARAQYTDMMSNNAVRGPESLSQGNQCDFLPAPRPHNVSLMDTREQVTLDDPNAKSAHSSHHCSASMVKLQQPRQVSTGSSPQIGQAYPPRTREDGTDSCTPGCQFVESGVGDNGCGTHHLLDEYQASEEREMAVPFTPQAAAGVAGIEIGPAAGEWNLPRIQQRIIAARLQAEVHQHFTSAVEILLAVQMSLDVDYQEASQRSGRREPAPVFLLTPAQRAYYADLIGRELQYVTALWTAKLQSTESPTLAFAMPAVNRLRGTAGNNAVLHGELPDPTRATGAAAKEEDSGVGNKIHTRAVERLIPSMKHPLTSPAHATHRTASSTSCPNSDTPAHSAVASSLTSMDHRLSKAASCKSTPVGFREVREMQTSVHRSRPPRDSSTDSFNDGEAEASHDSSSKVKASSPRTPASNACSISATSTHASGPALYVIPEIFALHSPAEPSGPCKKPVQCNRRHGRQPIPRKTYLIEAISTNSSIKELSSVWDDKMLGSKTHGPFDASVMQRIRQHSTEMKTRSLNEAQNPREARSPSHSKPFALTAECSDGRGTGHHGSLLSQTPLARSSESSRRQASQRKAGSNVFHLSPSQLTESAAEFYVNGGAVASAPPLECTTTDTALHRAEDAPSLVSARAGSSQTLSSTASLVAFNSCSLSTPQRHHPAHLSESDVDAAARLTCQQTAQGGSIQAPLRPPSPITKDTCACGSAPAPSTLLAVATSGGASVKTQPVSANVSSGAPASPVSSSRPLSYVKDGGQHSELSVASASSAVKRCHMAQQGELLADKQRQSTTSFSVKAASDMQLSSGIHTSSAHPRHLHCRSSSDGSTATNGIISAITTEMTSITPTACSTGAQDGDGDHQESWRFLHPSSSTRVLAAWDENESPFPCLVSTQRPYAYEHKTIICDDGQPCKRLILCKPEQLPLRTRMHGTNTGISAPSNASPDGVSESAPPHPRSPTLHLTPTHSQPTPPTLVIVGANARSLQGSQTQLQHEECTNTDSTVNSHGPRTSPVVTSASQEAERLEEHLPLAMAATHAVEASPPEEEEACISDDERAVLERSAVESVVMRNTSSADPEKKDLVLNVSTVDDSASQDHSSGALLREAVVNGGSEASSSGAAGCPESGLQTTDGTCVNKERREFIFSGDVAQSWLDEEGSLSGNYYNAYRVKLKREEATSLKWRGPPVFNLRAIAAAGDGDVEGGPHSGHDNRSTSPCTAATDTAAEEPSAALATDALHRARLPGGMPDGVTKTSTKRTDIHFEAPRGLLKSRDQASQHQQPSHSEMLRQSSSHPFTRHSAVTAAAVTERDDQSRRADMSNAHPLPRSSVEAKTAREGLERPRATAIPTSLSPDSFTQLPHDKVYGDDNFIMFRRAAAAAVSASRPGMPGATQRKHPETSRSTRAHPWPTSVL